MSPQRFLILTQYFPPEVGAAQTRLAAIAARLVSIGHEVEVVTAMPNYPVGRILPGYAGRFLVHEQVQGISTTRVWLYASMGRGARRLVSYVSFAATSVIGLARARRPDYLFVESPPLFLAVTAALASRLWRAELIVNVSDLWPDAAVDLGVVKEGRLLDAARRLERWIYRRATVINAVTDGIADVIGAGRAPIEKVRRLPNGVDVSLFKPSDGGDAPAQLGLPGEPVFVYTGNLGHAQGLDNVLRAMTDADVAAAGISLVLMGDGSERAALERLKGELGLDTVSFVDPVPLTTVAAVLPYVTAAVVSLRDLPTNLGARPSKLFPAFASARPVLYAGDGEGAALVERAQAGIVVPNAAPAAIARAMVTLATDPRLAAELGANGRALAEREFSWQSVVDTWLASLP